MTTKVGILHTVTKACHREDTRKHTLVIAIDKSDGTLSTIVHIEFQRSRDAYPPRHAKQAMPKTLMFLTRARGPEAPVRALRRARAALSMLVSATGDMVRCNQGVVGDSWRSRCRWCKICVACMSQGMTPYIDSRAVIAGRDGT